MLEYSLHEVRQRTADNNEYDWLDRRSDRREECWNPTWNNLRHIRRLILCDHEKRLARNKLQPELRVVPRQRCRIGLNVLHHLPLLTHRLLQNLTPHNPKQVLRRIRAIEAYRVRGQVTEVQRHHRMH